MYVGIFFRKWTDKPWQTKLCERDQVARFQFLLRCLFYYIERRVQSISRFQTYSSYFSNNITDFFYFIFFHIKICIFYLNIYGNSQIGSYETELFFFNLWDYCKVVLNPVRS